MKRAYLVQHKRTDTDHVKVIGIYSSEAEAKAAVQRLGEQAGFRTHLNGFSIDVYDLDKDNWSEGFVEI